MISKLTSDLENNSAFVERYSERMELAKTQEKCSVLCVVSNTFRNSFLRNMFLQDSKVVLLDFPLSWSRKQRKRGKYVELHHFYFLTKYNKYFHMLGQTFFYN